MRKKRNQYRTARRKPGRVLVAGILKAFVLLLVPTFLILLSSALSRAYYAVLDAPWLRVDDMQVSGLKYLDRKEVLNALGIPRNESVLALKLSKCAKHLEELPWVQSSIVRLDLPRRIVVEITEREPMALIQAEEAFLLDVKGKLFLKVGENHPQGLPLITGFTGMKLAEGNDLPPETVQGLKALISAMKKCSGWLPSDQVLEYRWHKDEGFALITAPKGIPVELGWDDFDRKMNRLQQIMGMLKERQWIDSVNRIDLDYSNRAYIGGNFPIPKGT